MAKCDERGISTQGLRVANTAWGCSSCPTVVFIPDDTGIRGGVCSQKSRGCAGNLSELNDETSAVVRAYLEKRGIDEVPWLCVVPAKVIP